MSHRHGKDKGNGNGEGKKKGFIALDELPPELRKAILFCWECKKNGRPIPDMELDPVHRAILSQLGVLIQSAERAEIHRLQRELVKAVKERRELVNEQCEETKKLKIYNDSLRRQLTGEIELRKARRFGFFGMFFGGCLFGAGVLYVIQHLIRSLT